METRDIAQLFVTAVGKIEFYWNFYTGALLALIGWLVSRNMVVAEELKLLVTVGYLAFALMNVLGLWGSYTVAEALRKDLLHSAHGNPEALAHARHVLAKRGFDGQKRLAVAIHGVLGCFVLFTVWSAH